MDNGEIRTSGFNEYGEMDVWENGIFDIKKVILKELFDIKRGKINSWKIAFKVKNGDDNMTLRELEFFKNVNKIAELRW